MKRVITVILTLCSLSLLCATSYAQDTTSPDTTSTFIPAPASLLVDSENIYEGMDKSYSEGYIPRVADGYAIVVVPLICDGELEENKLRVSVSLGDYVNMPFVCKNYEKAVSLSAESLYLISFSFELKQNRINGNYPVSVNISATDKNKNQIRETITVYVVISDGKAPNDDRNQDDEIVLTPKVLVQSYESTALSGDVESSVIKAGERIKVKVTLVNTSKTEILKNITVTAAAANENFILQSISDCRYIESVGKGETFEVSYEYLTKNDMPAGQYNININYDFAYGKGMASSGSAVARVEVMQALEMEFSVIQIPEKAVISDVVQVGVQAINISRAKAYNVRAKVEADGFAPVGTIFIGDVDGGMSAEGFGQVAITGLAKGNFTYGQTKGTVTFFYEDAEGNELTEVKNFITTIESPFSVAEKSDEDKAEQWWIVMAGISAIITIGIVVAVIKKIKERKNGKVS